VVCAEDAVELMEAGATWVQLGTSLNLGNLSLFGEIKKGLEAFLEGHGWTHRELIGSAQPK
jgi:dihydroorotate dehydrogenase